MKTNTTDTPFSASERLARRIGAGWQWLRHSFIPQSLNGLKDMKQAVFGRKENLYYTSVMRHLWGRWPWLTLVMLVVVMYAAVILFSQIFLLIPQTPSSWLVNVVVSSLYNGNWYYLLPAIIVGCRYRAYLRSSNYQSNIYLIPQSRLPVYQALALSCLWITLLNLLISYLSSGVSWVFLAPAIKQQLSILQMITGIHPDAILASSIKALSLVFYRLSCTSFFLFLIIIPLLGIREIGIALIGAFLVSTLATFGQSIIITGSFFLIFNFWKNAPSNTDVDYILIDALYCFAHSIVLLMITGWLWRLGRERFCRGRFPIEEE